MEVVSFKNRVGADDVRELAVSARSCLKGLRAIAMDSFGTVTNPIELAECCVGVCDSVISMLCQVAETCDSVGSSERKTA